MGKVVALSSFESHRQTGKGTVTNGEPARVIMFTGVRYERMSQKEDMRSGPMNNLRSRLGWGSGSKS